MNNIPDGDPRERTMKQISPLLIASIAALSAGPSGRIARAVSGAGAGPIVLDPPRPPWQPRDPFPHPRSTEAKTPADLERIAKAKAKRERKAAKRAALHA